MAVLLSALLCVSAAAAEKNGVKVGEGRLHPSLGLEGEYDSLVVNTNSGAYGDLILHIRPGLAYELGNKSVELSLAALGDWNLYTGIETPGTRGLSYFGGDGNLSVSINPAGTVGVILADRFSHGDRVTAVDVGIGVRSLSNEASIQIPIRPGGGALEITPGYAFATENFLAFYVTPSFEPGALNYLSHRPKLDARWKFLPKTALVLQVEGDIRQYGAGTNPPVSALYARTGLSGLLTPKVSVLLTAGYGNAFAAPAIANYESVIGQAEIGFILSPTSRLKAGYVRTFEPVPQFGWYGDNRGYLAGTFLLGGRLLLDVRGTADLVDYAPGASGTRADVVVGTDEMVTYRAAEWLDLAVGHSLSYRASSVSNTTGQSAFNYNRNQVFGRLTLRY